MKQLRMVSPSKTSDFKLRKLEICVRTEVGAMRRDRKRSQKALLSAADEYFKKKLVGMPKHILEKPLSSLTKDDIELIMEADDTMVASRPSTMKSSRASAMGARSSQPRRSTRKKSSHISSTSARLKMEKLQTPARQKPSPALGMVTPKFNPYAPMSVVRVPKEGEAAMSLTGSPLRITSVITESKANVLVPLKNGRVISLLPERGLRMSQVPEMDEDIRNQLKVLNDNIRTLLSKANNRK